MVVHGSEEEDVLCLMQLCPSPVHCTVLTVHCTPGDTDTLGPSHCHTVAESRHQVQGPLCLHHPHRGRHGRGLRPPAVSHLAVAKTKQTNIIKTEKIPPEKIFQGESEKKRLRRRFIQHLK